MTTEGVSSGAAGTSGTRRKSREAAMQFLFQEDFSHNEQDGDFDLRFNQFCVLYQVNRKARAYMRSLLAGIIENQGEIDKIISRCAKNWRLERLAATDRSLLRIAVYEMMFGRKLPPQVVINEAVEIAKRFAGSESPSFINGVLDAVSKQNNTEN